MAIRAISLRFPDLLIACDVCLCPYTDHGHCGIFRPDGFIDNDKSIAQLAAISKKFVEAGAHIIAPSGTGAYIQSPAMQFLPAAQQAAGLQAAFHHLLLLQSSKSLKMD